VPPKHGFDVSPRRLMVMGHIDEIGLIVTHIDDEGYLCFREVGGWDAQILVGQRVVIDTRNGPVKGVVGKKPIHLLRDEDRKKVQDIREMHIDIGAKDGKETRELVRIGDVAVIDAEPLELPNGRLASRALDNRLGSFVALEVARIVAEAGGGEWELAAVAAAPGIDIKDAGKHEFGSGPVITRGSTVNEGMFELLYETAEQEKIPFTVEASSRATGTDLDAVNVSRGGVPTGLVSIPLRYMHSPVEMVQLEDVHATARLIAAAALRIEREAKLPH
jgi:endoglucanase